MSQLGNLSTLERRLGWFARLRKHVECKGAPIFAAEKTADAGIPIITMTAHANQADMKEFTSLIAQVHFLLALTLLSPQKLKS